MSSSKKTPTRPQNTSEDPVTTPVQRVTPVRKSMTVVPAGRFSGPMTEATPPITGVPAAPKGGCGALKNRAKKAAARGGKPRPIRSGAAMAPGVPKPAAPSIRVCRPRPMTSICTRRSREM